jgi:Ser/Thr protein kinase RdoA (MazF antagonist)
MKPFEELTQQGQIRRYHQLAHKALQHYPLTVKKIRCITMRYNIILRVDAEEGVFALRISGTQNRTALQIRSEMQWIEAICDETDLQTACPLRTKDSQLIVTVEIDGIAHPRHVTITRWLYGTLLSQKPSVSNIRQLGQALAKLHQHSENYKPSGEFMTFDAYKVGEWGDLSYLEDSDTRLTSEQKQLFRHATKQSEATIQRLRDEAPRLYLINNDLHLSNALDFRGKVAVFDFDDCRWGHFIQDFAPTLHWLYAYPNQAELEQAFLAGYRAVREIPFSESLFKYAIIYRSMIAVNFMIHYRSHQAERLKKFINQAEETVKNIL